MSNRPLFPIELNVLSALDEEYATALPQVAVSARLSPSELRAAIDQLESKNLIRVVRSEERPGSSPIPLIELTKSGKRLRTQVQKGRPFILTPDEHEDIPSEDVDRALSSEIAKL